MPSVEDKENAEKLPSVEDKENTELRSKLLGQILNEGRELQTADCLWKRLRVRKTLHSRMY